MKPQLMGGSNQELNKVAAYCMIETPASMMKKDLINLGNYYVPNKVELVDLNGNKSVTDVINNTNKIRRSLSPNYINNNKINSTLNDNRLNKITKTRICVVKQPSCCSLSSNSSSSTLSGSNSRIFEAKEIYITSTTSSTKQNNYIATASSSTEAETTTTILSPVLYPTEHYSPRLLTATTTLTTSDHQLIMSRATSNSNNTAQSYSLVDPNKIHLFVKAGQDGRSQGACPFCQDVFLQLLIKAQSNKFNFDVITINLDNPPKEFKELSIKPPVLIHGSSSLLDPNNNNLDDSNSGSSDSQINAIILSDVDEIAEYLDRLYPNTRLTAENSEAKKVCLNVFSKFSFFIRDVASKSTNLEHELEKIDNYLRANTNDENKFLNGKSMSLLDCSLLPKLQHIRVAGESIKRFKIPGRFISLWRYLDNAYKTDAFQKSCPPDREIIWNWSKAFLSHKDLLQIMQEAPHKTLTIPDDTNIAD